MDGCILIIRALPCQKWGIRMKKLLFLGICIALLPIFTISGINARPPCERVCVNSHYDIYCQCGSPHRENFKWFPDYYDGNGIWVHQLLDDLILTFLDEDTGDRVGISPLWTLGFLQKPGGNQARCGCSLLRRHFPGEILFVLSRTRH